MQIIHGLLAALGVRTNVMMCTGTKLFRSHVLALSRYAFWIPSLPVGHVTEVFLFDVLTDILALLGGKRICMTFRGTVAVRI